MSGTEPSSVVTLCATPALCVSSALLTAEEMSPEAWLVVSTLLKLSWLASACTAGTGRANTGLRCAVLLLGSAIGLLTTFVCNKQQCVADFDVCYK